MSAWAEVDQFRACLASGTHATGEWRAFARTKTLRFRGRIGDTRIKVERACYHVPGKWRALGWLSVRAPTWRDTSRDGRRLTPGLVSAVLVAYDEWLSRGAPRVSRPAVLAEPRETTGGQQIYRESHERRLTRG